MQDKKQLIQIIEAALLAAGEPLTIEQLQKLFDKQEVPDKSQIREALQELQQASETRGVILIEVASGFTFRVKQNLAVWMQKLWEERPPRYSRAVLETLALIAYNQPITRAEIEAVRGVVVSTQMVKTLLEREWLKVVGHKDVPGRPALYATTKQFLDYFNLKSLADLPPLMEIAEPNKEEPLVADQTTTSSEPVDDTNNDPQLELLPAEHSVE